MSIYRYRRLDVYGIDEKCFFAVDGKRYAAFEKKIDEPNYPGELIIKCFGWQIQL